MKILVMLTRKNNRILRTEKMLTDMGHDVKVIYVDHFQSCHSYIAKKLDEFGLSHGKEKYDKGIFQEAMDAVQNWGAKRAFLVNFRFFPGWREQFRTACEQHGCQVVSWVVDPADLNDIDNPHIYGVFDRVYFYEKADVVEMKRLYGIKAEYCPVGYNDAYAVADGLQRQKLRDIAFVGAPYKSRMEILERLAKDAKTRGWKLEIYGPFFEDARYFWKKYIRKAKYPNISHVLTNGIFDSDQVAEIYATSKICLNMHVAGSKGLNPRNFEILSTGVLEMMDERPDYGIFQPGEAFAVFKDYDDMLTQLTYYLEHDDKRQRVAATGQRIVQPYSMEKCLKRMLEI